VTHLEGACMFSLDLLALECSNMNGSGILKCCSVTNRTESWCKIQPHVHAEHVCVCVCTCVHQHISLRETKTVMAISTSKSGTAHFTLDRHHVKKYCPFLFHAKTPNFFFLPFLQSYYALVFTWLCWFSTQVFVPWSEFCYCSPEWRNVISYFWQFAHQRGRSVI